MLTKLYIKNFRKNKRLSVLLDKVTIFRGPSGSGKSSLIGALKWLALNQPAGQGFVHWGSSFSKVKVWIDKQTVTRKRSRTKNIYLLNNSPFVAFGQGVPDPVRKCLNMTGLNFQRQHDGPFWFQNTAGEVSRRLNAIINLEMIDTTLSNLDKMYRETKIRRNDTKERLEQARAIQTRLRYVRALCGRLEALETKANAYQKEQLQAKRLQNLLMDLEKHKRAAARRIPSIDTLIKEYECWKHQASHNDKLRKWICLAEDYERQYVKKGEELQKYEQQLRRALGKTCPLCGSSIGK